jgi:hypothetical protein
MPEETEPVDDGLEVELIPVRTCYLVAREVPITTKAQMVIIRSEMGWNSWAEMIDDVVRAHRQKQWPPKKERGAT